MISVFHSLSPKNEPGNEANNNTHKCSFYLCDRNNYPDNI